MYPQFKIWITIFALAVCLPANCQNLYKTTAAEVRFFSSAPMEDIQANSKEGIAVLNPATGEISFLVNIRSLQFPKALMQEHFNENYMESDRYPTASFKGRIVEPVDLSLKREIPVVLSGVLQIHGVKREREISATLNIADDAIILKSRFNVACKDHDIRIPKILWKNIAEVVEVQVNANMKP